MSRRKLRRPPRCLQVPHANCVGARLPAAAPRHHQVPPIRPYVIGGAIVAANLRGFWLIQSPDLSDEAIN